MVGDGENLPEELLGTGREVFRRASAEVLGGDVSFVRSQDYPDVVVERCQRLHGPRGVPAVQLCEQRRGLVLRLVR